MTGFTTESYSIWKLSVELHSELTVTTFVIFSVPLFFEITQRYNFLR